MGKSKKKQQEAVRKPYVPDPNVDLSMFPIQYPMDSEEKVAEIYYGKLVSCTGNTCVFIFENENLADDFFIVLAEVVGFATKKLSKLEIQTDRLKDEVKNVKY
jgi:hypothetical protein